jgi:hypothetical protein
MVNAGPAMRAGILVQGCSTPVKGALMYSHELLVGGHNSAGSMDFYYETPSTERGNAFSNSLKKTREGHAQRGE